MDTLLVVAIVITGLAIVVQAGVLVAMYLMSKNVANNVEGLVSESKRIMGPMEHVTQNVQAASEDLGVIGKVARDEMNHVSVMIEESHLALSQVTAQLRRKMTETVDEVQSTVLSPVRQCSALANGVREGFRVLFRRSSEARDFSEPAA